jgi:surface protein
MTKYRIQENKIVKVEENVLQPKTKEQLKTLIKQEIAKKGNRANLNHIDVSKIADMSYLFFMSNFNGDISKWDVSNVETMDSMFFRSDFNGDISKWDVSNVKNMMVMFSESDFNGDISKWNVSKVRNMSSMFLDSKFNGDISKWKINNICDTKDMFKGTSNEIRKDIPSSYKKLFEKYSKYLKSGDVKDVKDIEDGLEKANRIKIFSDLLGSFSKGDGDVKKGFNWLFDIMSKRYNFSPDDIYSEVEYICAKILKN